MGSGRSSSSCEDSTGTSRSPPGRRTGRLPGPPGRQTPTLQGCTERPALAAAPPGPPWERERVTGHRAPRLRRGSDSERCRPSQGWAGAWRAGTVTQVILSRHHVHYKTLGAFSGPLPRERAYLTDCGVRTGRGQEQRNSWLGTGDFAC